MNDKPEEYKFKFILLGDTGVGKSCIVEQLRGGAFTESHDATIGVTFTNQLLHFGSNEITLQIWDTAGQEIFRSITRSYFRDSNCALIVYDLTSVSSFQNVESWLSDVREYCPPTCSIVLVGNKDDLVNQRQISPDTIQQFVEKNKLDDSYETSALTGHNVRQLFEESAMLVYSHAINSPKVMDTFITPDDSREETAPKSNCC